MACGIHLTTEQTTEVNTYSSDIITYTAENYLAFLDGSKTAERLGQLHQGLEDLGLGTVRAIYQQALR